MRVMTLNIWNYEPPWEQRRQGIVRLITDAQADVVALQECRHDFRFARGTGQAEQIAERTGYLVTAARAQVYVPFPRLDEGLAILTREGPAAVDVCPLTLHPHRRRDENHRICLAVTLTIGGVRLHVADTHFSLDPVARLSNARETAAFLARVAGTEPCVLMGDLNAEPDSPEMKYLTGGAGFNDIWTLASGDAPGYTYASYRPVRRIDYILGRNLPAGEIGGYLVGASRIAGSYPSDHLGIVADLPIP
jgi:endonuclease/exonuclease/phosphatase family metal-dependent hydrolase